MDSKIFESKFHFDESRFWSIFWTGKYLNDEVNSKKLFRSKQSFFLRQQPKKILVWNMLEQFLKIANIINSKT